MKAVLLAGVCVVALAGCAGRHAVEMATSQPTDVHLSCSQIAAEQHQIVAKVNGLRSEDESAHNANVAIGVVGALLFWPSLFALDTGNAENEEILALRARSEHLNAIAAQKGCYNTIEVYGVPPTVPTPPPGTWATAPALAPAAAPAPAPQPPYTTPPAWTQPAPAAQPVYAVPLPTTQPTPSTAVGFTAPVTPTPGYVSPAAAPLPMPQTQPTSGQGYYGHTDIGNMPLSQ
jgi:hypothetical protein